MIWDPVLVSLRVTIFATLGIMVAGLTLAWLFARARFPGKLLLEVLVLVPLILPPSVLGYYLLHLFGRQGILTSLLGVELLFTWQAAAIASFLVGLPLFVEPAKAGIMGVDRDMEDAARVDGASSSEVIRHITLPLARGSIISGLLLASARAMGEFGATLMVAGNIPGRTQTLPLAIYDAVQLRLYDQANAMVILLTGITLLYLLGLYQIRQPLHALSAWGRRAITTRTTVDSQGESRDVYLPLPTPRPSNPQRST